MSYHPLKYRLSLNVFSKEHYLKALNMLPYGVYPAPNYAILKNITDRDVFYKSLMFYNIPLMVYDSDTNFDNPSCKAYGIGRCKLTNFHNKTREQNNFINRSNNYKIYGDQTIAFTGERRQPIRANPNRTFKGNAPCIPSKRQRIADITPAPTPDVSYELYYNSGSRCSKTYNTSPYDIGPGTSKQTYQQPANQTRPLPQPPPSQNPQPTILPFLPPPPIQPPSSIAPSTNFNDDGRIYEVPISEAPSPPFIDDLKTEKNNIKLKWYDIQYMRPPITEPYIKTSEVWFYREYNIKQADVDFTKAICKLNINTLPDYNTPVSEVTGRKLSGEFADLKVKHIYPFLYVYNVGFHKFVSVESFLSSCRPLNTNENLSFYGYINKKLLLTCDMSINRTGEKSLDTIVFDKEEKRTFDNIKDYDNIIRPENMKFDAPSELGKTVYSLNGDFNDRIFKISTQEYYCVEYNVETHQYRGYKCRIKNRTNFDRVSGNYELLMNKDKNNTWIFVD